MKKLLPLMLLPLTLSLGGCSKEDVSHTIYTSIYPVHDFVSRIVGDKYKVVNLTPAGVEPHDYELSAKQIVNLANCKAAFISGVHMEEWYDSLPDTTKAKTCDLSKDITIIQTYGQDDPHIWLSPLNAIIEMETVTNYMSSIDPENKAYYEANLATNKTLFTELHTSYVNAVNEFDNKNIVVAHAAYGYMCNLYGLNQIAVNGVDPEKEPSSKTIEEIIEKVKQYNITTIFTEELISEKIARQIAEECNVKVDVLDPIETIEGDDNYISIMKDNLSRLSKACKQ
ncbi:MAG: zinc ABC transporter substrate-binding protein [Bacilli bacterium]|nr:zinc ABC transporter substrate-binding protein [Bacilli bacterium]